MQLLLPVQAGDAAPGTGQVYLDALPSRRFWGVHLCENPAAAEDRRRNLGPLVVTLDGSEWRQVGRYDFVDGDGLTPAQVLPEHLQFALRAIAEIEPTEGEDMEAVSFPMLRHFRDGQHAVSEENIERIFSEIENGRFTFGRGETMTYTVEAAIEASALLDWDAKLSEQSAPVQALLHRHGLMDQFQDGITQGMISGQPWLGDLTGEDIYGVLTGMEPGPRGYAEGRTDQRATSLRLLAAGIPGLRLRDHYSRLGEGWQPGMPVTRDVILFDAGKVHITHCNGVPLTDTQAQEALENVRFTAGL